MKKNFISINFLLSNQTAVHLYHDIAKDLPIIDYHCHLPPDEIATNNLRKLKSRKDRNKLHGSGNNR